MVQEPDEHDEPDDPTATSAPEIESHEPEPPSEAQSPDESDTPPPRPVEAPRVDHRRFRRELTPTWLAAVAALHDDPCPRLHTHELRVAYLGVGHSVTSAVIRSTSSASCERVRPHFATNEPNGESLRTPERIVRGGGTTAWKVM